MEETNALLETAKTIVTQANQLRLKHAPKFNAKVSYCCFFSQNETEFAEMNSLASELGSVAKVTNTGTVYVVPGIETVAGVLRVLKIRSPDPTRPEIGDADFSLADYSSFKEAKLGKPGFELIVREDFEMTELIDPAFNVRAYFSDPPVEQHPGIKEALSGVQ